MTLEEQIAEWELSVPDEIRQDTLWCSSAYRFATFLADDIWPDITRLAADPRTIDIAQQLGRSIRSVGATYAEAYSRASGKDRARIFEYSLGEARESRDWCFKGRRVIGNDRALDLIRILTRIVQILTVTVARERDRQLRPRRSKNQAS